MVGAKVLFKGIRFNVIRKNIMIEDKVVERDIIDFPESVIILPLLDENTILLLRQYRPVLEDYIYEVPAGVVEENEDIREAALRELIEETGYTANQLIEIGTFYPTPGYSSEKMHFFIARNLEYVGARPEPYEVIERVTISLDKAVDMIRDNIINDLKTSFIILYYISFYKKQLDRR